MKTSLYYLLKKQPDSTKKDVKDISANYQEAILEALIQKLIFIANETNIYDIVISGGVTANKRFRHKLELLNEENLYKIHYPPI